MGGATEGGDTPTNPLDRIVFFSDAVMAIAITLLVVEIGVPRVAAHDLGDALLDKWHEYLSFGISFAVIGLYWIAHHRMFCLICRYDRGLIARNLLFLLCVAFIPFPTAVVGEYQDEPAAVVFYATWLVITGVVSALLWHYASTGDRLIVPSSKRELRLLRIRALTPPIAFLPSIPLAFLSPGVAELTWIAIALFPLVLSRFHRDHG